MNEMAASIEQVTANTASLADVGRRDSGVGAGDDRRRFRAVAATAEEMATASQQVAASMTEMASSTKSVSRDTESLTAVGQRDGRGHRGDVAVDRGRRRQRRRPRRGDRGDDVVDQRDGGVDRGGRRDDREPGHRRSSRTRRRSSRCRGRSRRSRPTAARSAMRRRNAATSATQLDRSIQSVAALARQGDEVTRRVARDAEEGGATVQRSIQGIGAAARFDGAVGHGDAARWASAPTRSAASSTPST